MILELKKLELLTNRCSVSLSQCWLKVTIMKYDKDMQLFHPQGLLTASWRNIMVDLGLVDVQQSHFKGWNLSCECLCGNYGRLVNYGSGSCPVVLAADAVVIKIYEPESLVPLIVWKRKCVNLNLDAERQLCTGCWSSFCAFWSAGLHSKRSIYIPSKVILCSLVDFSWYLLVQWSTVVSWQFIVSFIWNSDLFSMTT